MQKTIHIGFLIFPGFPMACLTSFIEPLRAANEISNETAFQWSLITEEDGKVTSSAQVGFDPDTTLDQVNGLDYLILLSAPNNSFNLQSTPATLRIMFRHGVTMGAISGGVFPLMRAGLGTKTSISVHWCYRSAFEAEFQSVTASDQVVEIQNRLITASGAAAAFELALHMIETRLTVGIATEVAHWFQHPMMRKTNVRQSVPTYNVAGENTPLPDTIVKAIELFGQDMSQPITIADVANELDISPRHLERSFKRATGLSPSHYYRKMRMDAARQIIMYTNDRLSDVAANVGYVSVQVFNKHYQSAFGVNPREDRKRINIYRASGMVPVPSV